MNTLSIQPGPFRPSVSSGWRRLPVATTRSYKNAAGEQQEETEWHRVSFFGRLAEIAGEYLRKGRPVYVEGRIRTRKYQDKETGQDRFSTEIVAESMQLLGSREGMGGSDAELTPQEAEWLKALLDADGARDELEQALLDFLAEDGVSLP